jgi:ribosome biogenesis GTPase A
MPPFSGKKKKEQLQAKRQRKRDAEERTSELEREREKLRDELVSRGEEVNDDVLDAYMRERHPHQHDPARGRRAHRKEREQKKNIDNDNYNNKVGGTRGGSDAGGSNDEVDGEGNAAASGGKAETQMYSADRHHGVRSVFAKESPAVLAARKQLSYQPVPFRTTMPATGIPFSEWFTFPSKASSSAAPRVDDEAAASLSSTTKAALIAAEQERRLDRPLVATTAEALGGGSGSVVFPFAVELPSRGWHIGESGGDGSAEVEVEANTITAPAGVVQATANAGITDIADARASSHLTASAAAAAHEAKAAVCSTSGSDEEVDKGTTNTSSSYPNDGNGDGKNINNGDARREEALIIKGIEQKRFDAYVRCLDTYPLPAAIVGLDISSYERNLEVWQQLWRTVELSDVLLIVADARYPILHSHLGLLTYITKVHRKPCVFVLNKEDLVPASTLRCWLQFLHLYLTDLGFVVESAENDDGEKKSDAAGQINIQPPTPQRNCGKIVLRTFTANPRPETAGQRDGDVDVLRRQKHRKGTDAKMYEKLRTGKLNATKHLGKHHHGSSSSRSGGSSDDSDEEREGEGDELRYSTNENFLGMQAAEYALQHDRRAYKELEVVAKKITELLALCRRLGTEGRAARGETAAAAAAAVETGENRYTTSSLPCTAPRAARKNKKAQKQSGGRRKKNDTADGAGVARRPGEDNVDDGVDEDTVEDRAPDSPSYVHIGFIGHPNVGKSSLLNCIRGTKVVSVSATPGHTKHVQTIPVPEEKLTLVDSPGLALPVFGVPRPLQAVLGTHQIAQTRDPQSGVSFLAAYLPIEKLYGLQRPDYAIKEDEWSSYELCEAYAKKRGYYVKHGKGALDIHRAAIAILQEAYEGRLALFYAPPELNLLQSAWYRERIRPHLLLTVFGSSPQ